MHNTVETRRAQRHLLSGRLRGGEAQGQEVGIGVRLGPNLVWGQRGQLGLVLVKVRGQGGRLSLMKVIRLGYPARFCQCQRSEVRADGSPVIRGVAGQRAIGHVGGGPAPVQVDGVDDSVPLQELGQLPQTHPAQTGSPH